MVADLDQSVTVRHNLARLVPALSIERLLLRHAADALCDDELKAAVLERRDEGDHARLQIGMTAPESDGPVRVQVVGHYGHRSIAA
jgi:hypothetical protein